MEEELLNGFSSSEVFRLYKFLCIYESKLMRIKRSKRLYKTYPGIRPLETFIDRFKYYYATKEGMQAIGLFVPVGLFYCIRRNSKPTDLLYHIRNSIAHGQIKKEEDTIFLIDYDIQKNEKVFSGRGTFDGGLFFDIIDCVNSNITL